MEGFSGTQGSLIANDHSDGTAANLCLAIVGVLRVSPSLQSGLLESLEEFSHIPYLFTGNNYIILSRPSASHIGAIGFICEKKHLQGRILGV